MKANSNKLVIVSQLAQITCYLLKATASKIDDCIEALAHYSLKIAVFVYVTIPLCLIMVGLLYCLFFSILYLFCLFFSETTEQAASIAASLMPLWLPFFITLALESRRVLLKFSKWRHPSIRAVILFSQLHLLMHSIHHNLSVCIWLTCIDHRI